MGGFIELNDTLQITTEQGFPAEILNLEKHREKPILLEKVEGRVFEFSGKPNARLYHPPPTRVFLVHNIEGKWLYWGHVLILEQTIATNEKGESFTSGKYKIIKIYDPAYQEVMTKNETSSGKSYF